MKILETRILRGASIHSPRPCFLAVLDLEDLDERSSAEFEGFADRLIDLLPGLADHRCSMGYRGGFARRLREGTYMAHVTEHVLIELQCMAGTEVGFGKARKLPNRPRQYTIVTSYRLEKVVTEALPVAVRIVESLCRGETPDLAEDLRTLCRLASRYALGPSTQAIVDAAERRGIPVFRVTEEASLFQLGWGKNQKRIQATMTSHTSHIAVELASDKDLTKALLEEAGLPVPRGELVRSAEDAIAAARRLRGPVAIKPYNGNQGKGVSLNLTHPDHLRAAFDLARTFSRSVLVEQFIQGQDYRVLVVGDRVVAVAARLPAQVIGDGRHTVGELVAIENRNPMRGEGHAKPMTRITLDEGALQVLARQELGVDSVPEADRVVVLRENANLSTGGSAEDVTELIHPRTALACVSAAQKIGLDVAGIDVVCEDISLPLESQRGAIIEVNAAPGIRMHQHPSRGQPHDVGAAIIDALFPAGANARIPLTAVTGTNGKTTTTLLIGHTLQNMGIVTGVTTTEGIYLNGRLTQTGDCTGYWSARAVLTHPTIEAAVLETARGGLFKRGLAFDASDVGVVLNIHDDHLGQHGAETLEDLASVKALIARTARKAVVLNAEDERVARMAADVQEAAEVLFFSLDANHPTLQEHLDRGGRAVYLRRNMLMLAQGDHRIPLLEVERIPFTLKGRARHNIANALAAVAALWAQGIASEHIVAGLTTFTSSVDQNPGRMNMFRVGSVEVMLDYAHNAESYRAIIQTARQLPHRRLIGVITAPGDRYPEKLREIGRLCGEGFDEVIVRQMHELRGRPYGEAPRIILEGVQESGLAPDRIHLVLDERKAVDYALQHAQDGDLVVIGCADTADLIAHIARRAEVIRPAAATDLLPDAGPPYGAMPTPSPRQVSAHVHSLSWAPGVPQQVRAGTPEDPED